MTKPTTDYPAVLAAIDATCREPWNQLGTASVNDVLDRVEGVSHQAVRRHIDTLVEAGLVHRHLGVECRDPAMHRLAPGVAALPLDGALSWPTGLAGAVRLGMRVALAAAMLAADEQAEIITGLPHDMVVLHELTDRLDAMLADLDDLEAAK